MTTHHFLLAVALKSRFPFHFMKDQLSSTPLPGVSDRLLNREPDQADRSIKSWSKLWLLQVPSRFVLLRGDFRLLFVRNYVCLDRRKIRLGTDHSCTCCCKLCSAIDRAYKNAKTYHRRCPSHTASWSGIKLAVCHHNEKVSDEPL